MADTKTWRTKQRPAAPETTIPGRWGGILQAAPAMATVPPRPHGDLTRATPEEIAAVSQSTWDDWRTREYRREAAIKRLLAHLDQFPGETWQQRWEVSGLNEPGRLVRDLERPEDRCRSTITGGLEALLCLRVIRPSLPAMRSNKFLAYAKTFRVAQDDPLLDVFFKQVDTAEASRLYRNRALFDVCCALTTQGIALADLTPEAMLHYAKECRELAGVVNTSTTRFTGHLAWEALHEMEHFPPQTPRTLKTALRAGRLTVSQLVNRYPITDPQIAQLFIDYLSRRQPGLDYNSLESISRELVSTFWCAVEKIDPGGPSKTRSPRLRGGLTSEPDRTLRRIRVGQRGVSGRGWAGSLACVPGRPEPACDRGQGWGSPWQGGAG